MTERLRLSIKQQRIQNFKTGDLLTISTSVLPIITHKAVVVVEGITPYIYHFHPDFKNGFGGNLIRENAEKYLKGKDLLKVEKAAVKPEKIQEAIDSFKGKKYNLLKLNCEHFATFLKDNSFKSSQIKLAALIIMSISAWVLIKQNNVN